MNEEEKEQETSDKFPKIKQPSLYLLCTVSVSVTYRLGTFLSTYVIETTQFIIYYYF